MCYTQLPSFRQEYGLNHSISVFSEIFLNGYQSLNHLSSLPTHVQISLQFSNILILQVVFLPHPQMLEKSFMTILMVESDSGLYYYKMFLLKINLFSQHMLTCHLLYPVVVMELTF